MKNIKQHAPLLAVVVVCGTVGSILLANSHAATPAASVESESGTISGAGNISDSTASGGHAIKFGSGTTGGSLPAGVTLTQADGGPNYYSKWANAFPSTSSFLPIGVFPAETPPSQLAAMGINFFTPMRDDNAGVFTPVWSAPGGNGMNDVNATPGFYAGGWFYNTINGQAWGSRAAFESYGDELDGACGQFFTNNPASISAGATCGNWGGLSEASFLNADAASRALDSSRPVYLQLTGTYIDGNNNYHYSTAEKQAICSNADILSFDLYQLVYGRGGVWNVYDNVKEARGYCQNARPVMDFVEQDTMDNKNVYPLPAQTVAEVWNEIIGGARGVEYFDQYKNIANSTYTGGGHYAAGAMYSAIKTVNAQVQALAPVINDNFANGYVTSTGAMSIMTKYSGGHFYVFAIPHQAGAQTVTFTLAGAPNTTATVLNESRSVTISGGKFTDSFANENTVHIYEIN